MNLMDITQKIKRLAAMSANGRTVADLRIGLGYTAATLNTGQTGLAYTFLPTRKDNCTVFPDVTPIEYLPAKDLLEMITASNFIKTAAGLAVANALFNIETPKMTVGDILDIIPIHSKDCVGMVGNFAPLVERLRKKVGQLLIFEQIDETDGLTLPSSEIKVQLPGCSVAIISATTIINHSFDRIMDAAAGCREVVVLGASTPMQAEVFKDTPVTCLSGIEVTNSSEIQRIVSIGGGMQRFKHCIRKINLRI